ncbi:ATP-binding protein [Ferrimonas balearica]|uniref:hybrid sensor histidine kinase/response regulator n=1 Tax=Ferrimonas balearica TaxID=44012 RepID=UPI001C996C4B|nr:ATP-binding protein [Ferrimonas balearica]MBY5991000.1 response regulator [Ferrimonas balearica]
MHLRQLTLKLFAAIFVMVLLASVLLAYWAWHRHFQQLENQVTQLITYARPQLLRQEGTRWVLNTEAVDRLSSSLPELSSGVITLGGVGEGYRFGPAAAEMLCADEATLLSGCLRLEGEWTLHGGQRFYYSVQLNQRAAMLSMLTGLGAMLGIWLLAGLVLYRYAASWFLTPLDRILDQLPKIGTGRAKFHTLVSARSGLAPLTQALSELDAMLQERQLNDERLQVRLRKALLARSEFMANASHEIRTPINSIIGFVDCLKLERDALHGTAQEHLDHIANASEALVRIVDDVLDFSKLDAGKMTLESITFPLAEFIERTVDGYSGKASGNGVRLITQLDPALPSHVIGDENRLGQILGNLISNAVKFSPDGQVRVSAGVERRPGRSVELSLSVVDTGVGIEEKALAAIFDPYAQADTSTTRRFGGSGLGLAICKQLADLMDARLTVQSKPGRGSTFTLQVPLMVAKPPSGEAVAPSLDDESALGHLKVMVVEDNHSNQALMRAYLSKLGVEDPILCNNGQEAVDASDVSRMDVILMDCQMPVMDGFTASGLIRRGISREALIVAITANVTSQDRALCEQAGMDLFLTKPLTLDALKAALGKGLAARGRAMVTS